MNSNDFTIYFALQFARYFQELTNGTTYSIVNLNFIHPGQLQDLVTSLQIDLLFIFLR